MLLKRAFAGLLVVFLMGSVPSVAEADVLSSIGNILTLPLQWAGGALVKGGADKLKGTIDDVDQKLKGHEAKLSDLVGDVKGKVDDSVDKVNRSLEARLGQFKTGNDDTIKKAISQVDGTLRERLIQAHAVGTDLISALDDTVQKSLREADQILRDRTADIDRMAIDLVAQANDAAEARIAQADEAVGRRLGNVDVIGDKQRSAFEGSLIRSAVLIGLVVFVVFVLRQMWREYAASKADLSTKPGHARVALYARRVAQGLSTSIAGAALGAAVLYGLYLWLPQQAVREGVELTQLHERELEAAVLNVDYPRAKLHASHLEFLSPATAAQSAAQADKTALIRDLVARPTLLATPEGASKFADRLRAVERGLGPRPDADTLVLRAVLKWSTGPTRREEHEAASLAARALRLAPRRFAMAPLARVYVRTFLDTPYFPGEVGSGRDAASYDDLAEALADAAPDPPDSPFEPVVALAQITRELELESMQRFVEMIEAHARGHFEKRNEIAGDIVKAWVRFDSQLDTTPGLAGSTILNVFRLNDAILVHARWFLENPRDPGDPKRLEDLPSKTVKDIELKLKLLPARVAWARRYEAFLRGPGRLIAEFQEAERFRLWERWTIEFEQAMLAHEKAVKAHGPDEQVTRWRLVLAAAALSLYVEDPSGRVPYAERAAAGMTGAPPPLDVVRLVNVNPRNKNDAAPPFVSDAPATLTVALASRGPSVL